VEAGVKVARPFADASLSFLRRMRDERLRRPSIFAMLSVACSLCKRSVTVVLCWVVVGVRL
jgi:hypothetical protein